MGIKLKVDKDLCVGCGLCVGSYAEAFAFDDENKAEGQQMGRYRHDGAVSRHDFGIFGLYFRERRRGGVRLDSRLCVLRVRSSHGGIRRTFENYQMEMDKRLRFARVYRGGHGGGSAYYHAARLKEGRS